MEALDRVTAFLAKLPGVGRRSGERMAYALARNPALMRDLSQSLRDLDARIALCERCANLTPREENPCRLCADPKREDRLLCVVEDPSDIAHIERSGVFKGRYFALLGRISPSRGEGLHNTRIESLLARVGAGGVEEVILALNSDVESDATAHFLRDALAASKRDLKLTRLARGLPAGSGVAYADDQTLAAALQSRQRL